LEKAGEYEKLAEGTREPTLKKRYADLAESYRVLARDISATVDSLRTLPQTDRMRRPGTLDGDITEADFPNDKAAIADARQALADAAHDGALENKNTVDEIEVTSPTGVVIATVTLLGS
jgi:hypothetical protein